VEEFAGNASITCFDSLSPNFSLSLCWCADTGASSHMTPHRAWFHEYEPYSIPIRVADGTVVKSAGIGSIHFLPRLQGVNCREVVFHKVLHVPQLQNNLLSVLYLTSKQGFCVIAEKQIMQFEHDGVLLFTATQQGQLAYLDGTTLHPHSVLSTTSTSILPLTLDLWHRRFAHLGLSQVKHLLTSNVVLGMHIDSQMHPDPVCEPCLAGKQHRIISRTATRCTTPLEIVHCDMHGPMPIASIQGHKYFIVFVDDFSRLWCLYFLKNKSDAAQAFLRFRAEIEKQTGHVVKCLHDDKEGGLSSNEFNSKLQEMGITRRFTMRAEPHSNGVAERAIRSISDAASSMLYESHLPSSFWAKAVSTAVFLHNRLPTSANGGKTPYESSSSSSSSHSSHNGDPPSPPGLPPPSHHSPSPPAPPLRPTRRSTRSRVPPNVWQSSWYRASYRPEQHRVAPQMDQYRNPEPQVASSDEESQSGGDGDDSESHSERESELLASEHAYLTLPEALEVAFKAGAYDDSPKSYAEAMTRPDAQKYHEAACDEIKSLVDNGTWELAQLPPGRKAIGCRWVFLIKRKSDGSIDRYKARLVAKGFSQRPGFDFDETYASTVKWATLRAILALAALEDLEIESIDISSAFLNGDIDAEVYMQQPEGFSQGSPEQVLRLIKSIYGLRQSPRLWHLKLNSVLEKAGFVKIKSDGSVWVFDRDGVRVILPVFVDDITLVSKSKEKIQEVKEELRKHFKLRDLGPTEFLLGVKVERDRSTHTLHLSQHRYTLDILKRFGFDSCSPVSTPVNPGVKLTQDQCPKTPSEVEEMRSVPYSHAVGSLMYLAVST
jgi:hypothetical protein